MIDASSKVVISDRTVGKMVGGAVGGAIGATVGSIFGPVGKLNHILSLLYHFI